MADKTDKKEVQGAATGRDTAFFTNPDKNKKETAYTVRYEVDGVTVAKTIPSEAAFKEALERYKGNEKALADFKKSNIVPEFHPAIAQLVADRIIVRAE